MRRARIFCLLLALLIAMTPAAFAAEGYERALDSVARVYTEFTLAQYMNGEVAREWTMGCTGSAFAIGKKGEPVDTFVTNKHVVQMDAEELRASVAASDADAVREGAYTLTDGSSVSVTYKVFPVVYIILEDINSKKQAARSIVSEKYDLACVKLSNPTTERKPATIALYGDLGRQDCWALGFPGLTDMVITAGSISDPLVSTLSYCTVTKGMTQMTLENNEHGSVVQHTAEINYGNSGGPLVNARGQVIGVNTWGYTVDVSQANVSQTTAQLKQFLDAENQIADFARSGGLPLATVLIAVAAALAVLAVVALALFARRRGVQKAPKPKPESASPRMLVALGGALDTGASYALESGKPFVIGTDAAKCALVYPKGTPGVSRVHCTVLYDGRVVTVKDEKSSYGTFLDAQKLEPGVSTVLHRGHKLGIGSQNETLILR